MAMCGLVLYSMHITVTLIAFSLNKGETRAAIL